MKYSVLVSFTDDHDNNKIYRAGDKYPRDGYKPKPERLEYLQSDNTTFKKPVIAGKKSSRA